MNRRSLLSVAVFLGMLFTGTLSANADPSFEFGSLSSEFDNPGLHLALGHFEHSNSGLHLALGHAGTEALSAFSGKGAPMAGLSFSAFSVPPDCRLEPSSDTAPGHAPEPATMLLLGTGLAGVAGFIRHKRRVKRS
ncbi:MAG TPA: PEP-CTERM sorting domain-containing protein [Pyrinomonadaceae bacterium]|nr:PEP-CTERM sorting domain-containing protein [Pyrinomonadaceae bacterium]